MNITFLGLKGAGKTCYLYMASNVLSRGLKIDQHTISARATDYQEQAYLDRGVKEMIAYRNWPDNSIETSTYSFDFKIDGVDVLPFTIYDYKGGILNAIEQEEDVDSATEIFDTFTNSACVVILIDGDTIMNALKPEVRAREINENIMEEEERLTPYAVKTIAETDINYIESLVQESRRRQKINIPILLTITKSDIFSDEELVEAESLLKNLLPSLFSNGNNMIVGITNISLGKNLSNEKGKLKGQLCNGIETNLHIPILFAIFQDIKEDTYKQYPILRTVVKRVFTPEHIHLFSDGKEAVII